MALGSKEDKPLLADIKKNLDNPFHLVPLHEMICFSISQVNDQALKAKMANHILLIGGKGFN